MKNNNQIELLYTQQYRERLKSLELKRKVILDIFKNYKSITGESMKVLERNFERPEKVELNKINPLILSMLLHSLFNISENLENKIIEFEKNRTSKYILFEILFWAQPSKYPFPNCKIKDYKEFFNQKKKRMKELNLGNFLELYAFESVQKDDFLQEIKDNIMHLTLYNIDEYLWMRDFFMYLDVMEKNEVKMKIHPYIYKVLSTNSTLIPVVIDGNNILMCEALKGPDKISTLLEHISKLDKAYFPFYIVFDENAKYKFETKYFSHKRTYYHSPADEFILRLAKEINGVVCSRDRFKDYGHEVLN
ncbi:MAG: ribonuclease, partial [Fervidobacterium sp.]